MLKQQSSELFKRIGSNEGFVEIYESDCNISKNKYGIKI